MYRSFHSGTRSSTPRSPPGCSTTYQTWIERSAELYRVLRLGGRLIAVTNSAWNLAELWSLVGETPKADYVFGRENGKEVLRRQFPHVKAHDIDGEVTFPDHAAARAYVTASPVRGHKAGMLPPFDGPLVARRRVTVFVADK